MTTTQKPRGDAPQKPRSDDPRINHEISAPNIRLIDSNGNMIGVVSAREGMRQAEIAGLDLVEISPHAEPPVCKIMNFGKFKYEAQKKAAEQRKKQKVIVIKEIKLRPVTDKHDLEVKMRSAHKFLAEGDKVKFTLKFRGREFAHQEIGQKLLEQVQADLGDGVKMETYPRMEGRQLVMIVAPK